MFLFVHVSCISLIIVQLAKFWIRGTLVTRLMPDIRSPDSPYPAWTIFPYISVPVLSILVMLSATR